MGQRGDKGGRPRGCSLIYLHGTSCTGDLSEGGCISKGLESHPVESGGDLKVCIQATTRDPGDEASLERGGEDRGEMLGEA